MTKVEHQLESWACVLFNKRYKLYSPFNKGKKHHDNNKIIVAPSAATPVSITSTTNKAPTSAPVVAAKSAPKTATKRAVKKPAISTRAAVKSAVNTTAKLAAKAAVKAVAKAKPKAASNATLKAKEVKASKLKKSKLVRDSFTIPKAEYTVLDDLKQRAGKLASAVKKSELIRAGVKALAAMSDMAFLSTLKAVPAIKSGRPSKAKAG